MGPLGRGRVIRHCTQTRAPQGTGFYPREKSLKLYRNVRASDWLIALSLTACSWGPEAFAPVEDGRSRVHRCAERAELTPAGT